VYVAVIYFILCFVCGRLFLLEEFSKSFYLFAAVCKGDPFCFVVQRFSVCVCFFFVEEGFSDNVCVILFSVWYGLMVFISVFFFFFAG
jgi:hypothetical protein